MRLHNQENHGLKIVSIRSKVYSFCLFLQLYYLSPYLSLYLFIGAILFLGVILLAFDDFLMQIVP